MTELQNNDLVSKLGAASPVEPIQTSQINLSDSEEKVSPAQLSPSEAQVPTTTTPQVSTGFDISKPIENIVNNVVAPVEKPNVEITSNEVIPTNTGLNGGVANIPNNSVTTPSSVSPVKVGNTISDNTVVSVSSANNGAISGNSISKVVNTTPQKTPDSGKKNPRTEYWKGLVSGVLISIGLVVIGLVLFDNGSLLASASNSIKLTSDDRANELVKMEDALAFGDSVSNSYIDGIIGNSDETSDNSELDNSILEVEDVTPDEALVPTSEDEDDNEIVDEDQNDLIVEEDDEDEDMEILTKNDYLDNDLNDKDSSLSTNKKSDNNSSKNKMAGSIVSIFDDTDEDLETDEIEDLGSDEDTSISYEHVNKVEDANWVISANCDNLHCGDISEASVEDLVLCTEFRQSDKLDDNSNRIGNNGVCRYKDVSELVHIEL